MGDGLRRLLARAGVQRTSETWGARVRLYNRLVVLLAVFATLGCVWLAAPVALGFVSGEGASGSAGPAAAEVQIVRELVGLRTATADTFLRSDGSRLARVYSTPVNYRAASGEWVPIDDTLRPGPTGWETKASATPVTLPASLASSAVSVGPASRRVSFSLEGASDSEGQNVGSAMSYVNAQPGVSVSYSVSSEGVREVLALGSSAAPSVYRYKLTYAAGLRPELTSAGGVAFSDTTGKVAYTMAPPTVTDASPGAQMPSTAPVHYELSPDGSALSLVLAKSWLEDPRRVFPVRVDPDIYFYEQSDCGIASASYANSNLCGGPLYVGANTETPKSISRAMLQFNLSSIPRDANVLDSRLALWFKADSTSSPIQIEANALTRSFTQAATWNKYDGTNAWTVPGGDFAATLSGKQTILDSYKNYWVNWGFAPLVQRWIQEPASNHGVLLKARNETVSGYDEFLRVNNSEKTDEPNLEIAYAPRTGVNEGDIVLGDELAAGGEVAVNAANGNLLVNSPDVNYQGEGYETRLTRHYNSQDENQTGNSFGSGWVLNTGNNTLLYPASWDRSYAFHEPGGGWTRFDPTPPANSIENQAGLKYTAQPGLNAGLVAHEDGTRTLTFNDTGTEWLFDKSANGFPQKIVEHTGLGNTLSLGYTESRLTRLTDTHGHELTITIDPMSHHATKIQNSNGEHWEYAYNTSHQLSTYKDSEGHEAKYGYTSTSGVVKEITDANGTHVITYDTKGRVTSLRKLVNGTVKEVGTQDEVTSFAYKGAEAPTCKPATDVNETTVTYMPGGATETYCFDANDHFTGPPSEAEEAEAGSGTSEEIAAGTCTEPEVFKDCGLEEEPPETPADLPPAGYGLADNNWLHAYPIEMGAPFNYFAESKPFQELKVTKMRRTMSWNTAFEAKLDDEHPGDNPGAKARREDTEAWIREVKAIGGEPMISFDMCPAGAPWEDPTEPSDKAPGAPQEETEANCSTPPTWQQYQAAMKYFFERPVLAEVQSFSAWNEPNRPDESTFKTPFVTGQYWRVLDDMCVQRHAENLLVPQCHVAAGEFLDSNMGNAENGEGSKYFHEYVAGTGRPTTVNRWAWHAYSDGVSTQEPGNKKTPAKWWGRFKRFREAILHVMKNSKCSACVRPAIWLSEQGVTYFSGNQRRQVKLARKTKTTPERTVPIWGHPGIAEAIINAYVKAPGVQLTAQQQVTRFYYYQLLGTPKTFDSGLLETRDALPEGLTKTRAELAPREIYRIYKQKTLHGG